MVKPRVAWLEPIDYEINKDQATKEIKALINEPINPREPEFGTWNNQKEHDNESCYTKMERKEKKIMKKLETILNEEDENRSKIITKGKGEDKAEKEGKGKSIYVVKP